MTLPDYEKLGAFYLGREYDAAGSTLKDDLVLYDSKDLTTHAVCVEHPARLARCPARSGSFTRAWSIAGKVVGVRRRRQAQGVKSRRCAPGRLCGGGRG